MAIYDGVGMGPWKPGFLDRLFGTEPSGFKSDGTCKVCDGEGSLIVNSIGQREECYNCSGTGGSDD